jgi:hypothetical protein
MPVFVERVRKGQRFYDVMNDAGRIVESYPVDDGQDAAIEASVRLRPKAGKMFIAVLWCMEVDEHGFLPGSLIIKRRGRIPRVRGRASG